MDKIEKQIAKLKKEAKKNYLNYCSYADDCDYGLTMAEYTRPGMLHSKLEFNRIMNELSILDPSTPKGRL